MSSVWRDVAEERTRQDEKWGPQRDISSTVNGLEYNIQGAGYYQDVMDHRARWDAHSWTDILLEEVAEAIDEARDHNSYDLRKELIQVAAVAVAWVENLDRRAAE